MTKLTSTRTTINNKANINVADDNNNNRLSRDSEHVSRVLMNNEIDVSNLLYLSHILTKQTNNSIVTKTQTGKV